MPILPLTNREGMSRKRKRARLWDPCAPSQDLGLQDPWDSYICFLLARACGKIISSLLYLSSPAGEAFDFTFLSHLISPLSPPPPFLPSSPLYLFFLFCFLLLSLSPQDPKTSKPSTNTLCPHAPLSRATLPSLQYYLFKHCLLTHRYQPKAARTSLD